MLSPKARQRLTSVIYSAALDPVRWQDVLEELARELDGAKIHLFGHDHTAGFSLGAITARHDPTHVDAFVEYYGALNPYPGAAGEHPDGTVLDINGLIPEAEVRKTEYFADFLAPQEELSGGCGAMLEYSPSASFIIGTLHPHRYRSQLDERSAAVVRQIVPDLVTAWRLTKQVASGMLERGEVIGRPAPGLLAICSASGHPAYLNGAARIAVERGDWIRIDLTGRLRLADPAAEAHAENMRRALARPEEFRGSKTLSLPDGTAVVTLAPFNPDWLVDWAAGFTLGLVRPSLMISIQPVPPPRQTSGLARYGLTEAEIEVVRLLASGSGTRRIAASRQVSIHTVRAQIKSAMWKCGVKRRTELVALALGAAK